MKCFKLNTGLLILLLILQTKPSFSQEIDSLRNRLSALNLRLKNLQHQIDSLHKIQELTNREISSLSLKLDSKAIGDNPETKIEVIAGIGAKIRSEPNGNGSILKDLSIGEKFFITNFFENNFLGAYSNGISGYVSKNAIEPNQNVEALIRFHLSNKTLANEEKIKEIEKTDPKLARLIRRFGEENARKITQKKYWIGMTKDMARESLGNPIDINTSSGSWGTHEQWVYRNNVYLYFEDGILKSYQN